MSGFSLLNHVSLQLPVQPGAGDPVAWAASELIRILNRAGVQTQFTVAGVKNQIVIGPGPVSSEFSAVPVFDGYVIRVQAQGVLLTAPAAKGILNAVYEFAGMLGVRFPVPGNENEIYPSHLFDLPLGDFVRNPRFEYRGVDVSSALRSGSMEERTEFFAKLQFNAVCYFGPDHTSAECCAKLGMRREIGGHGLSKLIDRKLFEKEPDLFRMFQPVDFGGHRMADSNLCISNPKTRQLVSEEFQRRLKAIDKDIYAVHAWADDLPAGGWCMCPDCRSYSPQDQNMLAMRLLCHAADLAGSKIKLPVIAYHDTITRGAGIPADPRMMLTWAPRERCYAHAIDDPACPRNAWYWNSLKQWFDFFGAGRDPHTFEYYFDQLLFNGLRPFLPHVIAADNRAYQNAGFTSHMVLQVNTRDDQPDWNLLFFARNVWDDSVSADSFARWILPESKVFGTYLLSRASIDENAMKMCDHDMDIYLDYRFLPETDTPFAWKMAEEYELASDMVKASCNILRNDPEKQYSKIFEREIKHCEFASSEYRSMHEQQLAGCHVARYLLTCDPAEARLAAEGFIRNRDNAERTIPLAEAAGYMKGSLHFSRLSFEMKEAAGKANLFGSVK